MQLPWSALTMSEITSSDGKFDCTYLKARYMLRSLGNWPKKL